MTSLSGKTVFITGASSGIGAAAARIFAKEGCQVVLAARRGERLEQLAREIRESGGEALPQVTDVTVPAQIEASVEAALRAFGRIDILYNNAGFGRLDWLERLDPEKDVQQQIAVDLVGMICMARAVLPHMYSRRAGTVINMCSIAGWIAPPLYAVYGAAKFGVRGFTEALRREALGYDVSVCIVYPSTAATDFGSHIGTSRAKQHFRMPSRLQLSGEQVARSVVSLARRPRRELVIPWWMLISMFLNSHLGTLSDRAQGSAVHPYHEL